MLERRHVAAGGISDRSHAYDRFTGRSFLDEVQFCLRATLNHAGSPAYRTVFASNPAGLHARQDGDSDADFAHKPAASSQFTRN